MLMLEQAQRMEPDNNHNLIYLAYGLAMLGKTDPSATDEAVETFMQGVTNKPCLATKPWVKKIQAEIPGLAKNLPVSPADPIECQRGRHRKVVAGGEPPHRQRELPVAGIDDIRVQPVLLVSKHHCHRPIHRHRWSGSSNPQQLGNPAVFRAGRSREPQVSLQLPEFDPAATGRPQIRRRGVVT